MNQYVKEMKIRNWSSIIEECLTSGIPGGEWCAQHNITKDQFYYWNKKVRDYFASENGMINPCDESSSCLIEVPIARVKTVSIEKDYESSTTTATIEFKGVTTIVKDGATREFMENIGRLIQNAL